MWTEIMTAECECVQRGALMVTFMREGATDYQRVQ